MKHIGLAVRSLPIIVALVAVGTVLAQTASEPLTIVGPYYQLTTSSGLSYTISGPPGTYQISGQAVTPGLTPVNVVVTITIPGTPTPGPGPTPPPPPPNPGPPVVVGKMWVVMVVDTASPAYVSGSFQSKLWGSTTIATALAAAPVSAIWRHYDAADPLVASTNWGKTAVKAGLPSVVVVDEKGNANPMTFPADEAGIVAAAKKARGL